MPYTVGFHKFPGGGWVVQVIGITGYSVPCVCEVEETGNVWVSYSTSGFSFCLDTYTENGSLVSTYEYSSSSNGLPGEFGLDGYVTLAANSGEIFVYTYHEANYDAPTHHRIDTNGNASLNQKLVFSGAQQPSITNTAVGRTAKTVNGSDGILAMVLEHTLFLPGLMYFLDESTYTSMGYFGVTGGGTGGEEFLGAASNTQTAIGVGYFSVPTFGGVAGFATFGGGAGHASGGSFRVTQSFTMLGSGSPGAAAADMDPQGWDNAAAVVYAFPTKLVLMRVVGITSVSTSFAVSWRKNIAVDFTSSPLNFATVNVLISDTSLFATIPGSTFIYVSGTISGSSNAVIYRFEGNGNYINGIQFSSVSSITIDKKVDSNNTAISIYATLASASGIYVVRLAADLTPSSASALGLTISAATTPTVTNNTDTLTFGSLTGTLNQPDSNGNTLSPIALTVSRSTNTQPHSTAIADI